MAESFRMPDLGEGIREGEIVEVLVSAGDSVQEGQIILVVETDKAAVEIPSPRTGLVKEVRVKPHDVVHVGEVLMEFDVEEAKEEGAEKEPEPERERAPAAASEPASRPASAASPGKKKGKRPVPASPATRRVARELGVDLHEVQGTGPGGLVTADDVRSYAQAPKPEKAPEPEAPSPEAPRAEAAVSAAPAPPLPDFSKWGPVERVPLRSIRRSVAKQMALAWSRIPHVSHQDSADITELEAFRKENEAVVGLRGGRLTLTVFAIKAAAASLKAYPEFNASLDEEHEEIVLKHYYHMGMATDTERGLVVPVIQHVDRKSLSELSLELPRVADKARHGRLDQEDVRGGTFTVTNIGSIGGEGFMPIINYPQAAILGLGQARRRAVVMETRRSPQDVVPRLILPLVLAFDHRIADGARAARFLNHVIELLESPAKLMLDL